MNQSSKILSDIVVYNNYAKFIPELGRRETWDEICERSITMHVKRFPELETEIRAAFDYVKQDKVLPSMRGIQFAGKPIEVNPARSLNCSYTAIDDWVVFSEIMFLLLGGSGVGYSVQNHHIAKLPAVGRPLKRKRRHLVGDSIEGWADAVKVLTKSYFFNGPTVDFDFSDIRKKGTPLKTSGGLAPGPQPLKDCIHNIRKIFDAKEAGEQLTSLECHDIACYIADAVLAGGIRRAAMISLFDIDDDAMLTSKFGNWWETNPQRARANNSVVVVRHKITKGKFLALWGKVEASRSGEPGIFFTNDKNMGTNPCAEIALRNCGFCNLTTINVSDIETQEELNARARAATFIGTLQASYTDFHYLRDAWRDTAEKDALLGVSMTGIGAGSLKKLSIKEAADECINENAKVAALIGIKPAARITCIKPEGTASLKLGTSSGVHAWHAPYYLRRMRILKDKPIYGYLKKRVPKLMEDDILKPNRDAVLTVPIKAPEGAIFRHESPIELLERVKDIHTNWIKPGHRKGDNTHNVSCTVSVKDDQWEEVGEWMWANRNSYTGLSVIPYDGGTYVQAPFEDCTEEKYNELLGYLRDIDLTKVVEAVDETDLKESVACGGGSCEIR